MMDASLIVTRPRCRICGKPVPILSHRRAYCSDACAAKRGSKKKAATGRGTN